MATKHPGFAKVQSSVAREKNPSTGKPYGKAAAGRIVAAGARGASKAAHKANPRLNRVRGK